MVWVYYLDSKSDFLLASHAQGSPPWLADSKAGFEFEADCNGQVSAKNASMAQKKRRTEGVLEKLEAQSKKLDVMFERVSHFIDSKMKRGEDETDLTFKLLARYRSVDQEIKEMENDDDDTLGIELKTKMIQKLNQTKKIPCQQNCKHGIGESGIIIWRRRRIEQV